LRSLREQGRAALQTNHRRNVNGCKIENVAPDKKVAEG
jgi:hypothetical protein